MKAFLRLLVFGAVATMAASCGRATYSFNSKVPAYLGPAPARQLAAPVAAAPASSRPAAAVPVAATAPPAVAARAALPAAVVPQPRQVVEPTATSAPTAQAVTPAPTSASAPAVAVTPARPARLSLAQRLLVRGLMAAQLRKIKAARHNLARVQEAQVMSKAGRAALIALVGAVIVAILIAVAENGGGDTTFFILAGIIGYALLVTGIVLLVLNLVNG